MYKIMLADDEGIVIDSLRFILTKEFGDACMIESAKTGRSVIELAEHFSPDIAIMDIQMPGINGIEAMREIRETNTNTIFIVMSAYDKFDYAKEAIGLGVLEYLNKPVDRTEIIAVVRRAMHLIDREREKRSRDLMIREKMETVVPIIENGLVYNILFQEFFEDDIENFKNLLGLSMDYGCMMALVFGEDQEGNHMTNAVGTSVRVQNHVREVREVVKSYFPGIVGSVMANKIAVFIPWEEPKQEYNERIEMIEKETGKKIDVISLSYNRLMNHIKYMVARAMTGEDLRINMNEYIESKFPEAYMTAKKVCDMLGKSIGKELDEMEIGYLAMHIERIYREEIKA